MTLRSLLRDERGAVAVEAALVGPVLVLLAIGSFQVSQMIARQSELQSAAAEAAAIALAAEPDTADERDTVAEIISESTGLDEDHVTVTAMYRCGNTSALATSTDDCGTAKVSRYVKIDLTQVYQPIWAEYGMGDPITYNITRYVLFKQT
jgi:Flp pilus assembly protein TadG